ncbi:hypothetical protein DYB37_010435 [Aphanomyces astaci]|uniref:Myb/SANT-like domain-containing protein n=1 Tax=Aphanomyces astaci TaxID=112090 RepID=A0A418FI55_APHAT|nr:hypothetical protein DYB37_010435 [Aphanomyces astaci]
MSLTKDEMVEIYKQFLAQQASHATTASTDPGPEKPRVKPVSPDPSKVPHGTKTQKLVWTTAMVVALLQNRCGSHDHAFKGSKSAKQLSRTWGKIALAINLDCDQSVTGLKAKSKYHKLKIEYATICKELAKTGNSLSCVVEPPYWSDLQSWLAAKTGMGNVEYAALDSTEESARNRTIDSGFDSDTEHDNLDSIEQDIEEADGGMMSSTSKRATNVDRRQGEVNRQREKRAKKMDMAASIVSLGESLAKGLASSGRNVDHSASIGDALIHLKESVDKNIEIQTQLMALIESRFVAEQQ